MKIENLYRQVIMDHYRNPRNKGLSSDANYYTVNLNNPSCGDEISVQIKFESNLILDVKHDGSGCSICCSSASVMSETLKGKTLSQAREILTEFYEMLMGRNINTNILVGDEVVYETVHLFPARIKCATLAWKAAEQAIAHVEKRDKNGR